VQEATIEFVADPSQAGRLPAGAGLSSGTPKAGAPGNGVAAMWIWSLAVDELEAAERGLLDALRRGDMSASAGLLRDDFVITTAGWLSEPVGKQAWLEALTGRMTLDEFDLRVIVTRRYGDVGVVIAESSQTGTHDGRPFSITFRYTDVWVLESSGWRLAVRHASGAPAPVGE
jgi:ketosteroid isomerase-like protein